MECITAINSLCFYAKQINFKNKEAVKIFQDRIKSELAIVNNPNIEFLKHIFLFLNNRLRDIEIDEYIAASIDKVENDKPSISSLDEEKIWNDMFLSYRDPVVEQEEKIYGKNDI